MTKKLRSMFSILLCTVVLLGAAPGFALPKAEAAGNPGNTTVNESTYDYAQVVDFSSLEELKELIENSSLYSKTRFRLTNDISVNSLSLNKIDNAFLTTKMNACEIIIDFNGYKINLIQSEYNDGNCRLYKGINFTLGNYSKLIFTDTSNSGRGGITYSADCYDNGPTTILDISMGADNTGEVVFDGGIYTLKTRYNNFSVAMNSKYVGCPDRWNLFSKGFFSASCVNVLRGKCTINNGSFITSASDSSTNGKEDKADDFKYRYLSNITLSNASYYDKTDLIINGGKFESSRYNILYNGYNVYPENAWGLQSDGTTTETLPVINGGYFCGYKNSAGKYSGGGICLCGDFGNSYTSPVYDETKTIPVSKIVGKNSQLLIDGKMQDTQKLDFEDISRQDKMLVISPDNADNSASLPSTTGNKSVYDISLQPDVILQFQNSYNALPWWVPQDAVTVQTRTDVWDENLENLIDSTQGSTYRYSGKTAGTVENVILQLNLYDKNNTYILGDSKRYRVTSMKKDYGDQIAALPKFTESPQDQVLVNGTDTITINWATDKQLSDANSLLLYSSADGGKSYDVSTSIKDEKNSGSYTLKLRAGNCTESTKKWYKLVTKTAIDNNWKYTYSEPFTISWTVDGKEPDLGGGTTGYGAWEYNGQTCSFEIPFNFNTTATSTVSGNSINTFKLFKDDGKGGYYGVNFNHSYNKNTGMLNVDVYGSEADYNSLCHYRLKVTNSIVTSTGTGKRTGLGTYYLDLNVHWRADEVKISFYPEGGSGTMDSMTVERDAKAILPECTYTPPEGKRFLRWKTASSWSYEAGDTVYPFENMNLYAVWEDDPDAKPACPFTDVKESDYFYDAVLWAVENNITSGTSETTFSPNMTCSRGQVVMFLWNAAGKPEPKSGANPFTDVKSSDWYYKAVMWAVENGITSGTTATTFEPNAACTRSQVVAFQWRAAGKTEPKSTANPFTDVSSDSWYYKAVLWAVENGITSGTSATTFSPEMVCTRGQIVTFLYRQYK